MAAKRSAVALPPFGPLLLAIERALPLSDASTPLSPQSSTSSSTTCNTLATVDVRAVVAARRDHGRKIFFLDCRDAEEERTVQLVCNRATYAGDVALFDDKKLLIVGSVVSCVGHPGRTSRGVLSVYALTLELLRVAPTPFAIRRVVEAALATPPQLDQQHAMQALQLSAADLADLCAMYARSLAHAGKARVFWKRAVAYGRVLRNAPAVRVRRERAPRVSPRDLAILSRGEALAAAMSRGRWDVITDAPSDLDLKFGKLHPKHNLPNAEDTERLRYANEKKAPQIRWMVRRVKEVVAAQGWTVRGIDAPTLRPRAAAAPVDTHSGVNMGMAAAQPAPAPPLEHPTPTRTAPLRILDVGGGRGDLALVLAKALPAVLAKGVECRVTVIDVNAKSLAAGTARASANGLAAPRIVFEKRDVTELAASLTAAACLDASGTAGASSSSGAIGASGDARSDAFDVVVGLHACGGLSDAILALAQTQRRCGFVVCTCCFCANLELGVPVAGDAPWWAPLRDGGESSGVSDGAAAAPPALGTALPPGTAGEGKHARGEFGKRVLCQLAETNANRDLSRRAMRVVNILRLAQHERGGARGGERAAAPLRLMAFDEAYSPRNLVLVGAVAQC